MHVHALHDAHLHTCTRGHGTWHKWQEAFVLKRTGIQLDLDSVATTSGRCVLHARAVHGRKSGAYQLAMLPCSPLLPQPRLP